jgi:glutamine phosphoribosylpyrophosphate amidotransferase
MCGLFGGVGPALELTQLQTLAALARRRGPDAWGLTHARPHGGFVTVRMVDAGPDVDLRHPLAEAVTAPLVIGHFRLATSSGSRDHRGVQPLAVTRPDCSVLVVAHNGVVPAALRATWTARYGPPASGNDSELVARAIAAYEGDLGPAVALVGLALEVPGALVAATRDQLALWRVGLPLYTGGTAAAAYWCSLRFPGSAPLSEATAWVRRLPQPVEAS